MKRLVEFRHLLGFTQKEMAEKLEVTVSFYYKIENGERRPSYNFLSRFKKIFPNINIDFIFFG